MRFELSTLNGSLRALRGGSSRFALLALLCFGWPAPLAAEFRAANGWKPVVVSGADLGCLSGLREDEMVVVACREHCEAIPFQLDERDRGGRLVLDSGPRPNADDGAPGLDPNDEVVVMGADLGRRARPGELPRASRCGHEVRVIGLDGARWFYVLAADPSLPPSSRRYVAYDPVADVMTGRRVAIGFGAATPRSLRLRGPGGELGPDLLDRLKIRASARFFGILPLGRDEDDIESRYVAWRTGAIRVVRREEKWVRLAFGLRTPIFRSDTTFYPDFVEIPVHLRLNFPPSHFFTAIEVQALLDFADLRGWHVVLPGGSFSGVVGALNKQQRSLLETIESDSAALVGPEVTLVLALDLGETLSSLHRTILYRDDLRRRAPEAIRGERPGIGFRLTDWSGVESGYHHFTATSYALPPDCDLARFDRERHDTWGIAVSVLDQARRD